MRYCKWSGDGRINFAEMSREETHVVTLLSVALHYGVVLRHETLKETPRLSISSGGVISGDSLRTYALA